MRKFVMICIIAGGIVGCNKKATQGPDDIDLINADSLSMAYTGIGFINISLDLLLGKYVSPDSSRVDYGTLNREPLIASLVDSIGGFDLMQLSTTEDSIAFLMNAYNAIVLKHLPDYSYVPQDQLGFPLFKKKFMVAGDSVTLDELEKESPQYLKKFDDPRKHFALVCGTISCPDLHRRAFRGNELYPVLDSLSVNFINNESLNPIAGMNPPRLSTIFSWYADDFEGKVRDTTKASRIEASISSTLIDFVNSYLIDSSKKAKLQASAPEYEPFSWKVNSL